MISRRVLVVLLGILFLSGCGSLRRSDTAFYAQNLYRRAPYEVEGNYWISNMFYVSDRLVKERPGKAPVFTAKLGNELTYGKLRMRISPKLRIETMLPKKLKKKGWVTVDDVSVLDEKIFMNELADAIKSSPYNSLIVMTEGYKDNFELTAIKSASFAYFLDVNTPILLFDWPGNQSVSPWGYERARVMADKSGPYLAHMLMKIVREIKPDKLWIESSSLGCQVVCSAFEEMYKETDFSDSELELAHVVLSAPDVKDDEFEGQFKDEIAALVEELTVYVSSNDRALLLTEIIDSQKRLGRQKSRVTKQKHLEEARDILYLKSLMPEKIALVDVTLIDKASYGHGYYMESPEYFDDFYLRLFGAKRPLNRNLYLVDKEGDMDYWILRSER